MPVLKSNTKRQYVGVYMGIVQDNNDPKALGRLRLNIPVLLGKQVHKAWAEPCLPSVEVFTIPPIGSQVWVMFEEGDPDRPIWIGCLLKTNQPHTEAKNGSPNVRSIKTTEALRISLDDNVKEIQIDTGNGQTITLQKTDQKILINATQNVEITGNNEVHVNGNSKVTIDGGTVEVNGNSFKVVTTNSYDPFTMVPHPDGFTTFKAGG